MEEKEFRLLVNRQIMKHLDENVGGHFQPLFANPYGECGMGLIILFDLREEFDRYGPLGNDLRNELSFYVKRVRQIDNNCIEPYNWAGHHSNLFNREEAAQMVKYYEKCILLENATSIFNNGISVDYQKLTEDDINYILLVYCSLIVNGRYLPKEFDYGKFKRNIEDVKFAGRKV
jgi:hypothetical protein